MCSFNQLKCRGETTAVEDTRDPRVFPTILRVKSPGYCKSPVYSKKGNDQLILDLSCYPLIKTQCLRVTLLITRKKPYQTNHLQDQKKAVDVGVWKLEKHSPKQNYQKSPKKSPRKFSRILKTLISGTHGYIFSGNFIEESSNLQSQFSLRDRILIGF